MSNENLIERYVHEVGRNLPRRMRADVELELRSLLADSLEERQTGKHDDEVVIDLLSELGPPAEFAAQYLPEQKLIGPRLFPLFKLVLIIVLLVISGIHLILGIIGFLDSAGPTGVADSLWWVGERLLSLGESAIYILGIITLIFAMLEWLGVGDVTESAENWSPLDLPGVEDPDRLKRFELIFGIVGTVLLIVAVNFFPNWLGLVDFAGEEWGIKLLWADGFYPHVPWLSALWICEIALKMFVLQQGYWNRATRGYELLIQIFAILVLYRIMNGPTILIPEFFDTMGRGILSVVIAITIIDSAIKIYRLIVRPDTSSPAINKGDNRFSFDL